MRCPKCRLDNPPGAPRCDCGYDFASGQMTGSCVSPNPTTTSGRAPWLLETTAGLLLLLNMLLSGAAGARSSRTVAELLGAICAPAIIALIVVGIVRLSRRGRSRRGRAKVVLVTMIVVLLGNVGNLATSVRAQVALQANLNPAAKTAGGVLSFDNGASVTAPGPEWQWRPFSAGKMQGYYCARAGDKTRIVVSWWRVPVLDDAFMKGFVRGSVARGAETGMRVVESTFERTARPIPGSYRYQQAVVVQADGRRVGTVGYVLPSGCAIVAWFEGAAEPAELARVADSYRSKAQ
jgi:hypothetical protein